MPNSQTPNYKLNQWAKSDRIQMEDFNADNAKLDAALKSEADARCTADSAINTQLAKKGNCWLWTYFYTGDGTYGRSNPKTFTLPSKPVVVMVFALDYTSCMLLPYGCQRGTTVGQAVDHTCELTWTSNSVSLVSIQGAHHQMNAENNSYMLAVLIAADA